MKKIHQTAIAALLVSFASVSFASMDNVPGSGPGEHGKAQAHKERKEYMVERQKKMQMQQGEHEGMHKGQAHREHKKHMMQQRHEKMWKKADINGDGQLSRAEFLAIASERFDRMDKNNDGVIQKGEHGKKHGKHEHMHGDKK